jgi:hypothetical protein
MTSICHEARCVAPTIHRIDAGLLLNIHRIATVLKVVVRDLFSNG